MRKFIKLMFLRFELAHANRMLKRFSAEVNKHTKTCLPLDDWLFLIKCMKAWRKHADALDEQIKSLNAPPCPNDESEALSPRSTSPLFWVK